MAKKQFKLDLSTNNIITCAIYAVIGILFLAIHPLQVVEIIAYVIGALLIIAGILDILNNVMVKGVIQIALGAVVIACWLLLTKYIFIVLGAILAIKGVLDLIKVYKKGLVAMVPSLIFIVVGALFIVSNFAVDLLSILFIIIGVFFIANAVLTLFGMKIK
jgi:uncharacterized membrane protein HdeD (DUF308 family)